MAYEIKMKVQEKMASYAGGQSMMVCDNADYDLVLDLDAEWDAYDTVTVLFTLPAYQGTIETLCTGRRCRVPLVQTPGVLRIGVTAGEVLHTTRWMEINVLPSIRTTAGREASEIPPDVAQQIIERLDALEKGGGTGGGTSFEAGNALELDDGVLSVKTTDTAEPGNKLPITAEGVYNATKDFGDAIVCVASGDALTLEDAAVMPLRGLRLFGKSEQSGTADPDNPVPVISAGDDGVIIVTVGEDALDVPTPNGLPGVPVSSGGNYTDDDGKQWVCDEIDLTRGVYVKRVGVDVFGDTEGFTYRTTNTFGFNTSQYRPTSGVRAISNYGYRGTVGAVEQAKNGSGVSAYYKSGSSSKLCYLYDPSCNTLDALGEKLAAVPLVMVYNMAEAVEIPLTADEIAAYWTLRTTKPATVIQTDCGAGVDVLYVADTQKYIDDAVGGKLDANKLPEAINSAIAQAKEYGEFDGEPGLTPHIGGNGNWFVGDADTGVPAQGDDYVLTAQDKSDIAQAVVDLLPKYSGEVEDV